MKNHITTVTKINKALSNEKRLQIILWLKDPELNFPPQRDGDLVKDGVCLGAIADRLDVRQPTVTAYMQTLGNAGLVSSKRIKQWTFYKLRPAGFVETSQLINSLITET